jgi:hypothetical protein
MWRGLRQFDTENGKVIAKGGDIMSSQDQNQLIEDVSREVVATTAPEELPLFRATSAAYFQHPDRVLKEQQSKDEMLGFGVVEVVTLLTPYVLAIVTAVIKAIMAEVQKSLETKSTSLTSEVVKRLFKKIHPDERTSVQLTAEQLTRVVEAAYTEASRLKLPDDTAHLLADSIKGMLS